MKGRILMVDDEPAMCDLVEAGMGPHGYEVHSELSGAAALKALSQTDFDVVLTDLNMRGMGGLELCTQICELRPGLPVVVITGFGSMEAAIEAIRAGAYDFVNKPVELDALALLIARAIEHRRLQRELRVLRRRVRYDERDSAGIIGESVAIRRVLDLIPKAARSDVPVLVSGETGTGKELVARALHQQSPVAGGPFVPVNCAAIPETLLESELFGHVKGAFTDAGNTRKGLFVQASGGTLFLDEVGEIPLGLQSTLLRCLQEGRIRPVGADTETTVNCRLITATNRDLRVEAESGRFRSDLYYRLAVIRISMPPLRTRAGDVLLLAQLFLDRASERSGRRVVGMTTPVARSLMSYHWPGNVRELENCMERAVALTEHERLILEDLPSELRQHRARPDPGAEPAALASLTVVERQHIYRVLEAVEGNKSMAAQILGMDRRTLYRKLERFERGTEEDPPI